MLCIIDIIQITASKFTRNVILMVDVWSRALHNRNAKKGFLKYMLFFYLTYRWFGIINLAKRVFLKVFLSKKKKKKSRMRKRKTTERKDKWVTKNQLPAFKQLFMTSLMISSYMNLQKFTLSPYFIQPCLNCYCRTC